MIKEIGSKVRVLRYKKGWSQENLAQKTGVSISVLSQIENGEIDLQYSLLRKIASIFELPVSALLSSENKTDVKNSDLEQLYSRIKQYDVYISELNLHYERLKEKV